jgi:hypothetical protein
MQPSSDNYKLKGIEHLKEKTTQNVPIHTNTPHYNFIQSLSRVQQQQEL